MAPLPSSSDLSLAFSWWEIHWLPEVFIYIVSISFFCVFFPRYFLVFFLLFLSPGFSLPVICLDGPATHQDNDNDAYVGDHHRTILGTHKYPSVLFQQTTLQKHKPYTSMEHGDYWWFTSHCRSSATTLPSQVSKSLARKIKKSNTFIDSSICDEELIFYN